MDKRKLMHYSHVNSKVKHLGYHDGSHENPEKLATFVPRMPDSDTYELVRRWNNYPELVEALEMVVTAEQAGHLDLAAKAVKTLLSTLRP